MEKLNKKIIQADLKLEELKDKAREWDILAKENLELRKEIERLNNIIKEVREEVRIYEEQSKDGITNELDNYVFVQRLKNALDKGSE